MTVPAAASDRHCAIVTSGIDHAIRLSTAAAVLAVAGIAAYVSYRHAYAVVRAHGESGITARLEPATIDGLVYASSMAAYRLSVQAGNPLSERKLAQLFGRTSRRWARARITDARQASPLPDSPGTPVTA